MFCRRTSVSFSLCLICLGVIEEKQPRAQANTGVHDIGASCLMTIDQLRVEPPWPHPLQLERSASTLGAPFIDFPPKLVWLMTHRSRRRTWVQAMAVREAIYKTDYLISHNWRDHGRVVVIPQHRALWCSASIPSVSPLGHMVILWECDLLLFLQIFSPHILKNETLLIWLSEAHDGKVSETDLWAEYSYSFFFYK